MVQKQVIKAKIRQFIERNKGVEDTDLAVENFCEELSSIIVDAILSAEIIAPPGSVQVTGTAVAQTNPDPLTFMIK